MAQTVSFDFKNAKAMATDADIAAIKDQVVAAKATLVNKTGLQVLPLQLLPDP